MRTALRRMPQGFLALAVLLLGCRSPRSYLADPGPYDVIPSEWRMDLVRARAAMDAQRFELAQDLLRPLTEAAPGVIPVRIFFQEAELAGLARARSRPLDPPPASGGAGDLAEEPVPRSRGIELQRLEEVRAPLGEFYRHRAESTGAAADFALAARLASSADQALELLTKAKRGDPTCVWVHYGEAWWLARSRRFPEARAALERAFSFDPGHLPTMRLNASLLAGAGDAEGAIDCLTSWLTRGANDPLIEPAQRAEAQVDLAALYAFGLRPLRALAVLESVRRSDLRDPVRADLVEAVAQADLGNRQMALQAVLRVRANAHESRLALVDEALLHEAGGRFEAEAQAWRRLLAQLDSGPDEEPGIGSNGVSPSEPGSAPAELAWLLVRVQALARLERIERLQPPQDSGAPEPGEDSVPEPIGSTQP